ncbi:MAG: ATP-binding cassette domain-containing protein, partial [Desulfotomaculales bacterium]
MNVIEVKELTRKFGAFTAVDCISFAVPSGEMFGFLGPNGAGKTTTINMLCTLLKPTSGQALVAGHDVVRRPDLVRRAIGLVFQDGSLDEGLTAAENLYFHAVLYGVPPAERRRRVAEALEVVGLAGRERQRVRTFSGGMKRRLEIARGLLHRPR